MIDRIIRVITMDQTVYAEVEHDDTLTSEALTVVIIASALAALGAAIGSGAFIGTLLWQFISGVVISWAFWAFLTQVIGTTIFQGEAELGEMLRVIGYASAPRALGLLGFIPIIGWLFSLAGALLSLVAGFFAVREGLDLDTTKTIATVVIGWIVSFVITLIIGGILGIGGAIAGGLF
jgi:hypothetical protein